MPAASGRPAMPPSCATGRTPTPPARKLDSVIADKFDVGLLPDGRWRRRPQRRVPRWLADDGIQVLQEPGCSRPLLPLHDLLRKCRSRPRSSDRCCPTIATVYDDADVLAQNPYYADLKPVFQGGAVPRPSTVTSSAYNDVSTAYFTGVHNVLTGQNDGASAVATIEEDFQELMDELNS